MNMLAIDWQQGWELMGWTMCYFLVAGTLVALAGATIRYACLDMAPSVRYSVSLAVFAVLALSPIGIALWLAQSPLPDFATTALPSAPKFIALAASPEISSTEPKAPATVPTSTDALPDQDSIAWIVAYLPWVWIVGAPMTLTLLTTGLIGSERLRRGCEPMPTGTIANACQQLRTSLGIGRRVSVAICERIASPLLLGIVRPLILLPPAALTGWSPEQLEMVLLHELAHVRRWDNLVNLVQRLVESLLFFHPAVWLVSRQVRRDREECCDAVVVAHTAKPQAYAELLVSLATPAQPLAGLALARHPLSQRIRHILKLEDETMLVSRKTMGMVVLLFVAMLVVAVWQPSAQTVAEEQASRVVLDPGKPSPFPTLEAQRAADLAYKMLGIELESLSKEESGRVKALKFSGGLHVSNIHGRTRPEPSFKMQKNDLLVGLHVWPTESLEQVREVLRRDDLAELSPLKFYVIRQAPERGGRGAYGEYGGESFGRGGYGGEGGYGSTPPIVDKVVTGRIDVLATSGPKRKDGVTRDLHPNTLGRGDVVKIWARGTFPDQPINDEYRVESMGTVALGPTYGRVEVTGKTLLEAETEIKKRLLTMLTDVEVQVTLVVKAAEAGSQ